jgi:hypothetical protein
MPSCCSTNLDISTPNAFWLLPVRNIRRQPSLRHIACPRYFNDLISAQTSICGVWLCQHTDDHPECGSSKSPIALAKAKGKPARTGLIDRHGVDGGARADHNGQGFPGVLPRYLWVAARAPQVQVPWARLNPAQADGSTSTHHGPTLIMWQLRRPRPGPRSFHGRFAGAPRFVRRARSPTSLAVAPHRQNVRGRGWLEHRKLCAARPAHGFRGAPLSAIVCPVPA